MSLTFQKVNNEWKSNEEHINSKCLGNLEDLEQQPKNTKYRIIMIEVRGGVDKKKEGKGHRTDTIPICNEIIKLGCESFPIFYSDDTYKEVEEILSYTKTIGIIVRINPGNNQGVTNQLWHKLLEELAEKGKNVMPNPKVMKIMGSKDSLVKISKLDGGRCDTISYRNIYEWNINFPKNLTQSVVIKQNRGSTGEGIWVIKKPKIPLTKNTILSLQEASDNHKEEKTLEEFTNFCHQYLKGKDGIIVQQKFLTGIEKGEIRFNMIFDQIVDIVHKKPVEGGISATMHAGAIYTSYSPNDPQYIDLRISLEKDIPHIMNSLGLDGYNFPLIWTVDYIYDNEDQKYYIGEFNCSCVGIARQLDKLAPLIAKASLYDIKKK